MGALVNLEQPYFTLPKRLVPNALSALNRAMGEEHDTLDDHFEALNLALAWSPDGDVSGISMPHDKLADDITRYLRFFESIAKYASGRLTFVFPGDQVWHEIAIVGDSVRWTHGPEVLRTYEQLYQAKRYAKALELVDRVLAERPTSEVRYQKAHALFLLGRYEESAEAWKWELGSDRDARDHAFGHVEISRCLLRLHRLDEAEAELEKLRAVCDATALRNGLAWVKWYRGDVDGAIALAEDALRAKADDLRMTSPLHHLLWVIGDFERLLSLIDRPTRMGFPVRGESVGLIACSHFELDHEARGFEILAAWVKDRRLVEADIAAADAHTAYGRAKEAKAIYKRVLASVQRRLKKSPGADESPHHAAALLGLGRFDEAVVARDRPVRFTEDPQYKSQIVSMRVSLAAGEPARALADARALLIRLPRHPEATVEEARALSMLGERDAAAARIRALVVGRAHTLRRALRDPLLAPLVA